MVATARLGAKLAARLAVLQTPAQRATPLDLICLVGKLQGMFLHSSQTPLSHLPAQKNDFRETYTEEKLRTTAGRATRTSQKSEK